MRRELFANIENEFKERYKDVQIPKDFTVEEVAKHNSETDCYVIVHNRVYDVTLFLEAHPGGYDTLLSFGGTIVIFKSDYTR
jgi:cytochrome b involved in lipid metabolism